MAKTDGSALFDTDAFLEPTNQSLGVEAARKALEDQDFRQAIIKAFALSERDSFEYHAITSVSLAQVQSAVSAGAANGLHAWYRDEERNILPNPPLADIDAYISIFAPGASAAASLTSFASNAKKNSLRKDVAEHLLAKRYVDASLPDPKKKKKVASPPANPSFDFWAWSCRTLEWVGPSEASNRTAMAHHVLPIMMHHFGCVTPSEEAMGILKHLCSGFHQQIVEIGSGNGYWTLMLRRRGLDVTAVDSGQSLYRTMWIGDTVREDGTRWLKRNDGAKSRILLLVYPITAGNWTADIIEAYRGSCICVVGTQNKSGYTGFKDYIIDEWMAEKHSEFEKVAQISLPSFPGKDEAMFVFRRPDG